MTELVLQAGFTEAERVQVARLFWTGFAPKLLPAFGSDAERGCADLARLMRPERVTCARVDGALAGICVTPGVLALDRASLRRAVRPLRAARILAGLALLDQPPPPNTLMIEAICVDPARRGLGIGTGLLRNAFETAQRQRRRAVRLIVVDSNPRAAALYRREGFVPVGGGSVRPFGRWYGFERWTAMERPVPGPPSGA